MGAEEPKTFADHAAVWSPIIIAFGSLFVSWLAFKKAGQSSKEIFINSFRDKVKSAKLSILSIQPRQYTQHEKMVIIETVQDALLYQGYADEKDNHLTAHIRTELSQLQEEMEDIVGAILIGNHAEYNKDLAKTKLNSLLKQL